MLIKATKTFNIFSYSITLAFTFMPPSSPIYFEISLSTVSFPVHFRFSSDQNKVVLFFKIIKYLPLILLRTAYIGHITKNHHIYSHLY